MTDPVSPSSHGLSPERREQVLMLLILRHLYDGDVIEWPIPDGHPHQALFQRLEREGLVARWDRQWPLRDRYRLTEGGIARIEENYKPAEAEQIYREMRSEQLPPQARRDRLRQRGYDPEVWSSLHDPYLDWSTWDEDPGPYHRYVCERTPAPSAPSETEKPPAPGEVPPSVMDLDREAGKVTQFERDPGVPVADVS